MRKYDPIRINEEFQRLCDEVEFEIRRQARTILQSNPDLVEFIKGMGRWFFVDTNGEYHTDVDDKRLVEIGELIEMWREPFQTTGNPVRFTTNGPEITNW